MKEGILVKSKLQPQTPAQAEYVSRMRASKDDIVIFHNKDLVRKSNDEINKFVKSLGISYDEFNDILETIDTKNHRENTLPETVYLDSDGTSFVDFIKREVNNFLKNKEVLDVK